MSGKVSLVEMVLHAEQEAERIDTWERVLHSEGQELDPSMVRRRTVFRKMTETLELLMLHQEDFRTMVRTKREVLARAAHIRGAAFTKPADESETPPHATA